MLAPRLSVKTLPALPSLLNTFTRCALKLSFLPKTLNVPAPGLIASSVPLCMPALSPTVHAALLGAGTAAAVAALGMNTFAFEGADAAFSLKRKGGGGAAFWDITLPLRQMPGLRPWRAPARRYVLGAEPGKVGIRRAAGRLQAHRIAVFDGGAHAYKGANARLARAMSLKAVPGQIVMNATSIACQKGGIDWTVIDNDFILSA